MARLVFSVINDLSFDQRMHKICNSLSHAGHDVLLVGRLYKSSFPFHSDNYKTKRIWCIFKTGKMAYLEFNIRLFFYLLFKKFDTYSATDLDTILPMMLSAKLKSKKLFFDAHEYFTELPELSGRKRTRLVWELVGRICVPKADLCYTVNEHLAKILSEKYGQDFKVLYNVPRLKSEYIDLEKKENIILYHGWVNKGRGLEKLIEAMKQIDARLIIAGGGDLELKIREMIEELHLEHKVEITGFISPDNLPEYLNRAKIGYNLLEHSSQSYYYSLSNKFFTYIHAGIPGLSPKFPVYESLNKKFEVAVLCHLEVDEIVSNINRLLRDKEFYSNLANNCMLAKKEWNWQNEEKKLTSFYE